VNTRAFSSGGRAIVDTAPGNLVELHGSGHQRVIVERERRNHRAARRGLQQIENRASAAARRSFSDGHPSDFSSDGG